MRAIAIAAASLALSGCASTAYVKGCLRVREEPVYYGSIHPRQCAIMSWLFVLPVTFAWDVVTFPVQAIGGYYPYGDKATGDR